MRVYNMLFSAPPFGADNNAGWDNDKNAIRYDDDEDERRGAERGRTKTRKDAKGGWKIKDNDMSSELRGATKTIL